MDHLLAPDPAQGVFSTMLVVEDAPLELDPHLSALGASVRAVYGAELPADAALLAAEHARGHALGRLRLSYLPHASGGPRLEALARAIDAAIVLPGWDAGLELVSARVDGWNGGHKWVDRRLLDRLDAAAAPADALLVDGAGRVLETTRANVFALGEDGVLLTPPADGSILPGVTRARVIALSRERGVEVREQPLGLAALTAAREVFTSGSVRGVESVRSLDGAPLGGPGELVTALADALRERWLGAGARVVHTSR
ncbi:MAG TPA: aminotransferase class IV [Conexibacter sp.]|nr:aminotransferase class IV [Conexibacter sp.]